MIEQRLYNSIKRNNFSIFSTPKQRKEDSKKKEVITPKKNCQLFAQIYYSCNLRDSNIREFLCIFYVIFNVFFVFTFADKKRWFTVRQEIWFVNLLRESSSCYMRPISCYMLSISSWFCLFRWSNSIEFSQAHCSGNICGLWKSSFYDIYWKTFQTFQTV